MAGFAGEARDDIQLEIVVHQHSLLLLDNMRRLYESQTLCDVVLVCDGKEYLAHKPVLASSSEYFGAMFTGGLCETEMARVELKDIAPHSLNLLLDFTYSGKISLSMSSVEETYHAADLLQFDSVRKCCASFMTQNMAASHCLSIFQFSSLYSLPEVKRVAQYMFDEACKHLIESEDFCKLDILCIEELLQSDNLIISCEDEVMNACFSWVDFIPSEREHLLEKLFLATVRYQFLSPSFQEKYSSYFIPVAHSSISGRHAGFPGLLRNSSVHMRKGYRSWIHTFGGELSFLKESQETEIYNYATNSWQSGITLKDAKSSFASLLYDNKLYVIGGLKREIKLRKVHCYDGQTKLWTSCAQLINCCGDVQAAVLQNQLFVAGGSSSRKSVCRFVERYDVALDTWNKVTDMLSCRRKFGLVSLENQLFAIGGFDDNCGELQSMECYHVGDDQWRPLASMSVARYDFAAVTLSGFIYVIGGISSTTGSMSLVEKYDPRTDIWEICSSMKISRGGPSAAVLFGRIFALNGKNSYMKLDNNVEEYDEAKNKWYRVTPTQIARCNGSALALPFQMDKFDSQGHIEPNLS